MITCDADVDKNSATSVEASIGCVNAEATILMSFTER